jgi:hypothetical protein
MRGNALCIGPSVIAVPPRPADRHPRSSQTPSPSGRHVATTRRPLCPKRAEAKARIREARSGPEGRTLERRSGRRAAPDEARASFPSPARYRSRLIGSVCLRKPSLLRWTTSDRPCSASDALAFPCKGVQLGKCQVTVRLRLARADGSGLEGPGFNRLSVARRSPRSTASVARASHRASVRHPTQR